LRRITRRGLARRLLGFKRGVYVVGMHRSGTSAVTRSVNLMGVPLGQSHDLLGSVQSSNPTGHWESRALIEMNDRILSRLGGAWSAPPPLPRGWERAAEVTQLVPAARRVFGETYRSRQWVWKDPRICLTLPFWRMCTPVRVVAILVVRHPLEIAHSLEARNGFPMRYSLALWERYMRSALEAVSDLPVFVTTYDDLLRDQAEWYRQVSSFLASHRIRVDQAGNGALASFVNPGLRHSAANIGAWSEAEPATDAQRRLFDALRSLAGSHERLHFPDLPAETLDTEELLASHRAAVMSTGDQWLVPAV
jgi:hypothetical protein